MDQTRHPVYSVIPYFGLFFSGAASLVYELVWIRQLTLVFGATLYAISAVLCAFMIGLALGAWGIVRFLNWRERGGRTPRMVRLYGMIEGWIGLYGLGFPLGLHLLERIYPLAVDSGFGSGTWLHGLEFFLSTLLMLPPTVLMGATLPLIASWATREQTGRIFSNVSILYSINTFGAVFGCLYTQLFAMEHFGIRGTVWSAAAMNFLVLMICLPPGVERAPKTKAPPRARKKWIEEKGEADPPSRQSTILGFLILVIFIYSGMASLSSEILWTRVLVFPMGSTLFSFALILATFLFSIALGSLVAARILGNSRWILKFLLIELGIGLVCIGILPLFDRLPDWTRLADLLFYNLDNSAGQTLLVRSLFAFGLMFLPTLGFGLLFPLANRIHVTLFRTVRRTLGNCYAFNTLGAVLGTLLTPFVLIPLFGIRLSLFVIYSILILLSSVGLALYLEARPVRFAGLVSGAGLLIYGGYAYSTPHISVNRLGDHNLARVEISVSKDRLRLLDYREGDFATLSVVENVNSGERTLYVNGFSTATVTQSLSGSAYMRAMGFVPMVLHPDPRKALVICFGTGNTMGTVSLFPGVTVDGVEIDRNVLSLAHWFSSWNYDVLNRSNTRMVIQDGRTFTRWTRNQYDVITLEPMSPVQAGVVHLYSREFYEQALGRLTPGGIMVQWLPLHLVGDEDMKAIVKTFKAVFPHVSVWNSFLTRIVLLVGSDRPVRLDKNRFDDLMRVPALKEAARQMGVQAFLDFTDFFLTDADRLESLLQEAPVITDDHPILEFSPVSLLAPLLWQTDEKFLNLLRYRVGRFPPVTGITGEEERLLRRQYEIRTAQRFAVFSRRYRGPGEAAFASKNYLSGLEAVKIYLETKKDTPISLKDARWHP